MERFRVAALADLKQGIGNCVEVAGHRIALFRVGDDLYAIGDRCSHAEASLADGELFDLAVECPRHGSEFDLRTGKPGSFPATQPVPTYAVEVDGDDVFLMVDPLPEEES
jgi:3-phenylpropionate/trans-cinnamate dioxygenase ferredoxin subunit